MAAACRPGPGVRRSLPSQNKGELRNSRWDGWFALLRATQPDRNLQKDLLQDQDGG